MINSAHFLWQSLSIWKRCVICAHFPTCILDLVLHPPHPPTPPECKRISPKVVLMVTGNSDSIMRSFSLFFCLTGWRIKVMILCLQYYLSLDVQLGTVCLLLMKERGREAGHCKHLKCKSSQIKVHCNPKPACGLHCRSIQILLREHLSLTGLYLSS